MTEYLDLTEKMLPKIASMGAVFDMPKDYWPEEGISLYAQHGDAAIGCYLTKKLYDAMSEGDDVKKIITGLRYSVWQAIQMRLHGLDKGEPSKNN